MQGPGCAGIRGLTGSTWNASTLRKPVTGLGKLVPLGLTNSKTDWRAYGMSTALIILGHTVEALAAANHGLTHDVPSEVSSLP